MPAGFSCTAARGEFWRMMCQRRSWPAIQPMRWWFRSRRATSLGVWFAGLFALPLTNAQTVQFQLRNGDRVSGVVASESPTGLTLKTTWGGTIGVPADEIIAGYMLAPEPMAVPPAVLTPVATPSPPAAAAAKTHRWIGEMQAGMDVLFSERNRQLYTGRVKITHTYGLLRNLFDYQFSYGQSDGEVTDNRMLASLKTDYEL